MSKRVNDRVSVEQALQAAVIESIRNKGFKVGVCTVEGARGLDEVLLSNEDPNIKIEYDK